MSWFTLSGIVAAAIALAAVGGAHARAMFRIRSLERWRESQDRWRERMEERSANTAAAVTNVDHRIDLLTQVVNQQATLLQELKSGMKDIVTAVGRLERLHVAWAQRTNVLRPGEDVNGLENA